jgi:excisionase family DNA binding protein
MHLVNVKQLSEMISFSPKTIYDWVHKKEIPYYKVVGSLRFDYDEVERWIRSQRHKPKGRVNIL